MNARASSRRSLGSGGVSSIPDPRPPPVLAAHFPRPPSPARGLLGALASSDNSLSASFDPRPRSELSISRSVPSLRLRAPPDRPMRSRCHSGHSAERLSSARLALLLDLLGINPGFPPFLVATPRTHGQTERADSARSAPPRTRFPQPLSEPTLAGFGSSWPAGF